MKNLINRIKMKFHYWRMKPARQVLMREHGNGHLNSWQLHQIDAEILRNV